MSNNYILGIGHPITRPLNQDQGAPALWDTTGTLLVKPDGTTISPGGGSRNNIGHMRLWSMGSQLAPGGASASACGKFCTDAPFDGMRFNFYSEDGSRPSSNWQVSCAPTDEPLNDSAIHAYRPHVAGTVYNVFADNTGANKYGWRIASWGNSVQGGMNRGSSGVMKPGGRGYVLPPSYGTTQASEFAVPGMITTDWVDCDTPVSNNGDGRYYHLVRIYRAAGNGYSSFAGATAGDRWRDNAVSFPWYRRMFMTNAAADTVNVLANQGTQNPTESTYEFKPQPFSIEYRYKVPVRSLMAIGDSITEGGTYASAIYGYGSWHMQAALAKSTAANPIVCFNGGFSTVMEQQYIAQFEQLLMRGSRPTDVVWWNMSFNNLSNYGGTSSGTEYLAAQVKQRNLRMLELCNRIGAQAYICTNYYKTTPGLSALTYLDELNTWTRELCASGAAKLVDVALNWQPIYLGADNVHPSYPEGGDYIAGLFSAQL